jgi:hypothetical protein
VAPLAIETWLNNLEIEVYVEGWANMIGSTGCTSCMRLADFLRLRVIRDIMVTWGEGSGSIWWFLRVTGELTVRLAVKKIKLVENSKRWQWSFRLTAIQVYGSHG